MRPQDIERIAGNVAGAFTGASGQVGAGCGAFSNPQAFSCEDYGCESGYECGDQGNFSCSQDAFSCVSGFFCATDYTADLGNLT